MTINNPHFIDCVEAESLREQLIEGIPGEWALGDPWLDPLNKSS